MADTQPISIELNESLTVSIDPKEIVDVLENPLLDKVKEDIEYKIESAIEDIDVDDKVQDWMYNSFDISDYSRDIGEHAWQAINDEVDLNALADDVRCLQEEFEPIKELVSLSLNPDLPSMFKSLHNSKRDLHNRIEELEKKYAPFDKVQNLIDETVGNSMKGIETLKKFWVMKLHNSKGYVSFELVDYEENKFMFSSLYLKGEESYHSNDNIYYNPFTVFSKAILPTDKEMFEETKEAENV
tara:strand:- start:3051 stop:3776 length:726 start_codon:yes stop_codon:yes gene_type:complete